jgi:hypothetical protein
VKEKGKIKQHVRNSGNVSLKIISIRRGAAMEEMERSLTLWIEDEHQKNIPVSLSIIQSKALSLYDDWKRRLGESEADSPEFQASKGWFDRFKSRACIHNIKLPGEYASADKEAALEFIKTFSKIIEEGVILPIKFLLLMRQDHFGKKCLIGPI